MTTKKRRKNRLPPFIALIKATMATPAWRAMSLGARMLNIELRGRLRNDYANNGKVFLSCRKAAKAIGVNKDSIPSDQTGHPVRPNRTYGRGPRERPYVRPNRT
jgi:hypothetical protein